MQKKNCIIIVCSVISIVVILFDLIIDNKNGFRLSEVYVSLAAFIMLIGTAILQNIELSMQREDLELTRKEMKEQTKEFEENNKQAKFFELLKIKEDIYMNIDRGIISGFIRDYKSKLMEILKDRLSSNERLNELTHGLSNSINLEIDTLNYYREYIVKIYNSEDDESKEIDNILQKAFHQSVNDAFKEIEINKEIKKLQQFNYIIDKMYVDNSISASFRIIKFDFNFGSPQDMNFSEIYNQLKTREEDELYNILDKTIKIEDL